VREKGRLRCDTRGRRDSSVTDAQGRHFLELLEETWETALAGHAQPAAGHQGVHKLAPRVVPLLIRPPQCPPCTPAPRCPLPVVTRRWEEGKDAWRPRAEP